MAAMKNAAAFEAAPAKKAPGKAKKAGTKKAKRKAKKAVMTKDKKAAIKKGKALKAATASETIFTEDYLGERLAELQAAIDELETKVTELPQQFAKIKGQAELVKAAATHALQVGTRFMKYLDDRNTLQNSFLDTLRDLYSQDLPDATSNDQAVSDYQKNGEQASAAAGTTDAKRLRSQIREQLSRIKDEDARRQKLLQVNATLQQHRDELAKTYGLGPEEIENISEKLNTEFASAARASTTAASIDDLQQSATIAEKESR